MVFYPFTLFSFSFNFSFSLGFVLFGAVGFLVHMLNVPLRCGTRSGLYVLGKIFQAEGTNQIMTIVILIDQHWGGQSYQITWRSLDHETRSVRSRDSWKMKYSRFPKAGGIHMRET